MKRASSTDTSSPTHRVVLLLAGALAWVALAPPLPAQTIAGKQLYVPVAPCRIVRTITTGDGDLAAGETRGFDVFGNPAGPDTDYSAQGGSATGCGLPAFGGMTAIFANVVAQNAAGGGNLKAWAGDGSEPTASIINYQALSPGMNIANGIAIPVRTTAVSDDILVKASQNAVQVVIDVVGYFTALADHDGSGSGLDADTLDGLGSTAFGDITDVTAGSGLTGGATSGAATLSIDEVAVAAALAPTARPPAANSLTVVEEPTNIVGQYTSIAIGADGLPVISYYDETATALKVAHCNDVACSGGDETITTIADPNSIGEFTSIAIGSDGLPVISYFDSTASALKVAHCNDVACAGGDETITTVDDPDNEVGRFTSITIGADGLPVISYHDSTDAALKVAHCNDVACSGGDETITVVDDPIVNVGRFTSIAIGVDGLPVISYYSFPTGSLKVAHCNDVACSGGGETITTVDDPANNVGEFTSIVIGADGLPVIAYFDTTADALKVAHCNDVACSGSDETLTTVDDQTNAVGIDISITIGADGLPVISYNDNTAGVLKVAHCNDVACAGGGETITTVDDPANFVGQYTAITIGTDGLPVISYYDATAGALKVAHCASVFCTPYFRRR